MESAFARTPEPPYFAVIFTSQRTEGDHGYDAMADRMVELATKQPGFLGVMLGVGVDVGNGVLVGNEVAVGVPARTQV